MSAFRYLELPKLTGSQYMNLWYTLAEEKKSGLIPDTIAFLATFPFALAGGWVPAQEVREHINVDFCKANDIPVFWEPAMGGAYFFPDKNWNYFFFASMKKSFIERKKRWLKSLHAVKVGLQHLGVDATVEKNNILVGTRKISGVTVTHYGNKATGITPSINVNFDYALANQVLTPLGRRNKKLSEAIISLYDLGVIVEPNELNPTFKTVLETEFSITLVPGELTDAEKAVIGLA